MRNARTAVCAAVLVLAVAGRLAAQPTGTITGTVSLSSTDQRLHSTRLNLSPIGMHADSDEQGRFEFRNVPPGAYEIIARSPGLSSEAKKVRVGAGETVTVDLVMRIASIHESITVTATGREEVAVEAIQAVRTLEQLDLTLKSAPSLGDVLENEPGVAKRSSGPGNSRPVVRGFDGDRVLVMEDGIGTGTLSYQSGDHGEPIDVNKLERLEVVRGPATLLYGSSAIGGVVNAITRHEGFREHAHQGATGFLTGVAGTNNALGGGTGGFEYGTAKWQFWGSGGGQRAGAYQTPAGEVRNSQTRTEQTDAGAGRYGDRAFLSFNYSFTDSRYGVPVNPEVENPEVPELLLRKHTYRANGGLKNLGAFDAMQVRLSYSDYSHQEMAGDRVETQFFNKQLVYRTVLEQKKRGRWTGSIGFAGLHRDFKTIGEESLAPPTIQNSFGVFALESVDFESTRLQGGARLEHTGYDAEGLRDRSFTGVSLAAGLSQRLGRNTALAANYTHSFRAPALEELYNFGPHPGNLTFEIGNPGLRSEKNDGIDLSLRRQGTRVHGELNVYYYRLRDFVYLAPTGDIQDGLIAAEYQQRNSRFVGSEARVDLGLRQNLWLHLSADTVNARLSGDRTFLPRIPPVRGRIELDWRYKGLSVRPELLLSAAQNKIFPTETPTAGFAVANLAGSYTIAGGHRLHMISGELFNASDRLYRNHLSFTKQFAPEIGRGVRVTYTVQFF